MNTAIVNIDLVLAGAVVADVASILVTQLSLPRRFALGAVGIVGLAMMLFHVPSLQETQVALLASAGYAIATCSVTIVFLTQARSDGLAKRLRSAVLVMTGALTFTLGVVTWIAVRA